jgi:hypothetical protein
MFLGLWLDFVYNLEEIVNMFINESQTAPQFSPSVIGVLQYNEDKDLTLFINVEEIFYSKL